MIILHFSCNSNNYYIFVTARNNRKRREVLKENGTKIPRSYPVWISQCLRATKQRSYYLQGRIAWPLRKFQCTVLQSSSQTKKNKKKKRKKTTQKRRWQKESSANDAGVFLNNNSRKKSYTVEPPETLS